MNPTVILNWNSFVSNIGFDGSVFFLMNLKKIDINSSIFFKNSANDVAGVGVFINIINIKEDLVDHMNLIMRKQLQQWFIQTL